MDTYGSLGMVHGGGESSIAMTDGQGRWNPAHPACGGGDRPASFAFNGGFSTQLLEAVLENVTNMIVLGSAGGAEKLGEGIRGQTRHARQLGRETSIDQVDMKRRDQRHLRYGFHMPSRVRVRDTRQRVRQRMIDEG
jgi:hypothetical protein